MNWFVYIVTAVFLSFMQMFLAESARNCFPELSLILCIYLIEKSIPSQIPYTFWISGILKDILCSLHTGASSFMFLLAGFIIFGIWRRIQRFSWALRIIIVFSASFLVITGENLLGGAANGVFLAGDLSLTVATAGLGALCTYPLFRLFRYLPLVHTGTRDRIIFSGEV